MNTQSISLKAIILKGYKADTWLRIMAKAQWMPDKVYKNISKSGIFMIKTIMHKNFWVKYCRNFTIIILKLRYIKYNIQEILSESRSKDPEDEETSGSQVVGGGKGVKISFSSLFLSKYYDSSSPTSRLYSHPSEDE